MAEPNEDIRWHTTSVVEKYTDDDLDENGELKPDAVPYEIIEDTTSNILTTAGATRLAALLTGSGQVLDSTHTLLGVGDSATAANVADTALGAASGSSHQYWMVPDSTYPSASGATITVKATWGSSDGNFAWNEWALQITTAAASSGAAAGAGIMFNHKVSALGTKASGTWSLTITGSVA